MVVACQCGLEANIAHGATKFRCPRCRSVVVVAEASVVQPLPVEAVEITVTQQEHWQLLHRHAFQRENWNGIDRWFRGWERRIPNVNCDCRRHWRELVAANPPDFTSPAAFFAWTVEAHNSVNRRLGKPVMSLEDAWSLYS